MDKKLRSQIIKSIIDVGEKLAVEYGFTDRDIGEDRQKGIWGESATEYLEKIYGECTKEIFWKKPGNDKYYIRFDFRFADPRLCIWLDNVMASAEVSNWDHEAKNNDGDVWKITEYQVFDEAGLEYALKLNRLVKEAIEKAYTEIAFEEYGVTTKE